MRISDWSSDVCSSDLAEERIRFQEAAVVDLRLKVEDLDWMGRVDFLCPSGFCRARAVEPIDIAVAQHPTELTPGVIGDVDVVVEPAVRQVQAIGSVWGRERVCQDGYSTRVAGSVKKK